MTDDERLVDEFERACYRHGFVDGRDDAVRAVTRADPPSSDDARAALLAALRERAERVEELEKALKWCDDALCQATWEVKRGPVNRDLNEASKQARKALSHTPSREPI